MSGTIPLEKAFPPSRDERRDEALQQIVERGRLRLADRQIERGRRQLAADRIDVLEMAAEEFVKERVVLRGEVRPIPPEPIAPFRRVDLSQGVAALRFGKPPG